MSTDAQLRDGLYGLEYREEDERRVPSEERKTYDIKAFWHRHHEIVNLAARGYKGTEIAEILGISAQTVSNTLNSQLGKTESSKLREIRDGDTKKRLEQIRILTDRAVSTYFELFEAPEEKATLKDKVKVADTVLMELSGLRVPTRIQANVRATVLSSTEIAEFKARGIAAAKEAGLVVDVEPIAPEELESKDDHLISEQSTEVEPETAGD